MQDRKGGAYLGSRDPTKALGADVYVGTPSSELNHYQHK